jgi:hypothetical protein
MLRRINRFKPLDSFPFLSGDSYFFSCELYFKSGKIREVPSRVGRTQKNKSIFVSVGDLSDFTFFLGEFPREDFSQHSLVLHNGDDALSLNLLDKLVSRVRVIYGVNLSSRKGSLIPIPIGLENKNYFTNGIPGDYKKQVNSNLAQPKDRKILLLQSFSINTNELERQSCAEVASKLGATQLAGATPRQYRAALSQSRFVLSPAGNGVDCHRTWEAMYLGAIPIVRRGHWPFANLRLPVLVVDEWRDLLAQDLNKLEVPNNPVWNEEFWDSFYNEEE